METFELRRKIETACRRLLSEQNRDPYTLTYGCFDRRYWAWKLVDFPEVTFQRNIYPLAWLLGQVRDKDPVMAVALTDAVWAGLDYTTKIQHKDGSFDQAFPNEHSFGATAFLIYPLLTAYEAVWEEATLAQRAACEQCFRRGADFLCKQEETHGHIANHLAGAALSLLVCGTYFNEPRYTNRANELIQQILDHYSSEGWFLEYEGADPGYQTLCLYYLAQIYQLYPQEQLLQPLIKSVDFLSWFIHPDGSFAGEYGSRRTAIYYPGGLALLQQIIPMAASMTKFMAWSITEGRTVTIDDIDMGNMAPLLSNYILLLDALDEKKPNNSQETPSLPWQRGKASVDFSEAGIYVRSTNRYYAVLGVSNGGVLKVFDRQQQKILWNDGGYVGESENGTKVTTQITDLRKKRQVADESIAMKVPFYQMPSVRPSPIQFIFLRILNLTLMRSIRLGNFVKKLLVHFMISNKKEVPLELARLVIFGAENVIIQDQLSCRAELPLRWLKYGRPFVAIHMASSRYFQGYFSLNQSDNFQNVDVAYLNNGSVAKLQVTV